MIADPLALFFEELNRRASASALRDPARRAAWREIHPPADLLAEKEVRPYAAPYLPGHEIGCLQVLERIAPGLELLAHGSRRINRRNRAQGSVLHADLYGREVAAAPLEESEPMAFNETAFGRRRPLLELTGSRRSCSG